MTRHIERLRRLSMSDPRAIAEAMRTGDAADVGSVGLDARIHALARVAALIALDGPDSAFDAAIADALADGATPDDVVATMLAIGPTIGSARLVAAAPKVALGLGHDVGADLEDRDAAADVADDA